MNKLDEVFKKVCEMRNVAPEEVKKVTRKRYILNTRQLAMHFAKKYQLASLAKIGMRYGDKDHATVLHADKTIKNLCETDKLFRQEYDSIENSLYWIVGRKKIAEVDLSKWGAITIQDVVIGNIICIEIDKVTELRLKINDDGVVSVWMRNTVYDEWCEDEAPEVYLRSITYLDELQLLYLGLTGEQLKKV